MRARFSPTGILSALRAGLAKLYRMGQILIGAPPTVATAADILIGQSATTLRSVVIQMTPGGTGVPLLELQDNNSTGVIRLFGSGQIDFGATAGGGMDVRPGVGFSTRTSSNHFNLGAGSQLKGYSNNDVFSGSADTGLKRLAAGLWGTSDGSTGVGGIQNTAYRARVGTTVTNATAAMANITDLSVTVASGRKYFGEYTFFANDATNTDGLAFDLNGGSATFTSLEFGFDAQPTGSTLGTVTSTAAGTPLTLTIVSTSDAVYKISFGFVCNAGGTLIPRFSKNSGSTGNASIKLQSSLLIEDSPN